MALNAVNGSGQRTVSVLGSSGSVGVSTVDLLMAHPERFRVRALVGGRNAQVLASQARALRAEITVIADEAAYPALVSALAGTGLRTACGTQAVLDAAALPADCSGDACSTDAAIRCSWSACSWPWQPRRGLPRWSLACLPSLSCYSSRDWLLLPCTSSLTSPRT